MVVIFRIFALLIAAQLLLSCANYRLNIDETRKNWERQALPEKELDYKVFFIGNADGYQDSENPETFLLLKQELDKAGANSAVVFLGDNMPLPGLDKKHDSHREAVESCLKRRLDVVKDFKGQVFFLPGSHDWAIDGVDGIRDLEKFVETYLNREVFFPDDGCGGPEAVELTDKLGIILFDSEWFLLDWDKEPEINEECEVLTRAMFREELRGEARDFKGKNLIMVAHHPLTSQGWGGGHHSLKQHLYPLSMLTPPNNIPLPLIGSAIVWTSGAVATRQEIDHPVYQDYISTVKGAAKQQGNAVFVAGHEDNLQLMVDDDFVHVISGGGNGKDPVKLGKDTPMVYGGPGFSVINYYEDGEAWIEFFKVDHKTPALSNIKSSQNVSSAESASMALPMKEGKYNKEKYLQPELIYRQKIKDPLPTVAELMPEEFPVYEAGLDSVQVSVFDKGDIWDLNNFVWGELWTDYYFMDIKMPVLDLEKYEGGLTAFKQGGGFQTKSVRLKTDREPVRLYQIRSLRKSADKLFYPLNKTFARNVLEHQFTAGNPFSAFILNPIQDAIGIYHTNAKLVYVPKQPRLRQYNDVSDGVFLLEERPDEDWSDLPSFGNSSNIVSTGKVIEERMESDNGVIDQPMVLRNRLFDMVIGDWDRHDDQWRWASFPIEGTDRTLYRPIPRDRDQAFAKFEGLAFNIARFMVPYFRASHPYDGDITKWEARWLNFQARNFDAFFLSEMEWPMWEQQVRHIQNTMTDEVVEQGVGWLPDSVFKTMGPFLIKSMKSRRDNLMESARYYYEFLNKTVSVVGTKKENHILVERLDDRRTRVTVYEYKNDKEDKEKIYQRLFENDVTREIRIFGLEGDDDFEVKGKANDSPVLRLVGGIDEDKLTDESVVEGMGRKTKFYDDTVEDNKIKEKGIETEDQRNRVNEENTYIFEHINYNHGIFYPVFGYNPDDGIYFGAGVDLFRYGYRNEKTHKIFGQFQTATQGFILNYIGDFTNVFGRKGLYIESDIENPQYVTNFFGIGNETIKENNDRGFYRVRRRRFSFFPALKELTSGGLFYNIGPMAEAIRIDRMENHILSGEGNVRPEVFDFQYFGGIKSQVNYTNIQNPLNPVRGVVFEAEGSWQINLKQIDRNVAKLAGCLTVYLPLDRKNQFVYAFKIGGAHNKGKFDFFQANTIGGDHSLRGFSSERFAGRSSFYHNNEIRWNFLRRDFTHLPLSFGIAPAFDYGRVWVDNESSSIWHYGYGGSFYVAPLDYVALTLNYMRSVEAGRFVFTIGFNF